MSRRYTVIGGKDDRDQSCLRFIDARGAVLTTQFVRDAVEAELRDFRAKVEALVGAAERGDPRNGLDILQNSHRLRRLLLGDESLSARAPFEESLLLDVEDYWTAIPWELVADGRAACLDPDHRWTVRMAEQDEPPASCPRGHQVTVARGPLAITRRLGVRRVPPPGSGSPSPPSLESPRKALVVGDPREDLDETRHLPELYRMLSLRYDVELRVGPFATRRCVLDAIEDPAYAVIYVFAHGKPATPDLPPRILLRPGEFLCAHDLPPRLSGRPFVFLNCCWAARDDWADTCGAIHSMAAEVLRRGASAVIGPLYTVTAAQASWAALAFFDAALNANTFGRALMRVRSGSYARYLADQPDLSWLTYRLVGEPDRCLATSVWNDDGSLRREALAMDPSRLERRMETLRARRGTSLFTRADLLQAAASVTGATSALPAVVILAAEALRAVRALLLPRRAEPPVGGLIQRSDGEVCLILGKLLERHQERLHKVEQWKLGEPLRLGLPDLLDACPRAPGAATGGLDLTASAAEAQAFQAAHDILEQLTVLPDRMTAGAAIVLASAWRYAVRAGSNGRPEWALLAAIIDHPLVGTPWVMSGQADRLEHIRQLLMSLPLDGARNDAPFAAFVDRLLHHAHDLCPAPGRIDESVLFRALLGVTGR